MPMSQDNSTMNTQIPLGLEFLAIPYQTNQLADLQLWNSNFASISLFGINEYLTSDTKNIIYSLYKITTFIK